MVTFQSFFSFFHRTWGSINYLYCTRCEELFACTDYGSCSFHPQKPTFTDDENSEKESVAGYYTCCKATAIKFNPLNKYKVSTNYQPTRKIWSLGKRGIFFLSFLFYSVLKVCAQAKMYRVRKIYSLFEKSYYKFCETHLKNCKSVV